jgi:hypothetical protein
MSFAEIKPYFRAQLAAVGYVAEHLDAVNLDNVPSVTLDRTFHILVTGSQSRSASLSDQTLGASVVVSVFYAGWQSEIEAIDTATSEAEAILKSCVKISARTTGTGTLRNIEFVSHSVQPIDGTNDNIMVLTLEFNALCVFNID